MKTSLICLAIAIGLRLAFTQEVRLYEKPPENLYIAGGRHGAWLIVTRFDHGDNGYDPSFTYMLSKFKPVSKQLRNGLWEVHFECNICEKLP